MNQMLVVSHNNYEEYFGLYEEALRVQVHSTGYERIHDF